MFNKSNVSGSFFPIKQNLQQRCLFRIFSRRAGPPPVKKWKAAAGVSSQRGLSPSPADVSDRQTLGRGLVARGPRPANSAPYDGVAISRRANGHGPSRSGGVENEMVTAARAGARSAH